MSSRGITSQPGSTEVRTALKLIVPTSRSSLAGGFTVVPERKEVAIKQPHGSPVNLMSTDMQGSVQRPPESKGKPIPRRLGNCYCDTASVVKSSCFHNYSFGCISAASGKITSARYPKRQFSDLITLFASGNLQNTPLWICNAVMGRSKNRIRREEYSSDSGGSAEEDEGQYQYDTFESFTQPSRRKKRRHGRTKEDTMLGVFAEEVSDDDRDLMKKNIRYKGVSFVGQNDNESTLDQQDDQEAEAFRAGLGGSRVNQLHGQQFQQAQQYPPPSEGEEEDDYRPTLGIGARALGSGSKTNRGFGLGSRTSQHFGPAKEEDEDTYRPAFSLGQASSLNPPEMAKPMQHPTVQSDTMHTAVPMAPISQSPHNLKSTPSTRKYGLGASMLEKMGYKEGQGLGSEGQGMLNPIETKLRPERMGLGGVREMTQQARQEARRRGQIASDDEHDKKPRGTKSGSGTSTPRSRAKKVVYQTAEETAGGMAVPPTIQKLVDLTGKEVELSSVLGAKMEDELRIAHLARQDLKRFGDEWKSLQAQKKYVELERERTKDKLAEEETQISWAEKEITKIEGVKKYVKDEHLGRDALEDVGNGIQEVQLGISKEAVANFTIDEIIVALISPMIKKMLIEWDPLGDANANGLTAFLKSWSTILRVRSRYQQDEVETESGLFHHHTKLHPYNLPNLIRRSTPYESLLYHVILPKLRSVINNTWSPYDPQPLITLLEAWEPLFPRWIHNLLLEQVILPKLRSAIDHWNPRRTKEGVHLWIFPWLPYLGMHTDDLVKTVQHKFKVVLETWNVERGIVSGLEEWRELFAKGTLEDLLLQHILPKLALELRERFVVDPLDQKLEVLLNIIMPWQPYFRASTWSQLIESEVFSKWLATLHLWLTSDSVSLEEVGQWYEWWKHQVFPSEVLELDGVRRGFKAGLDLMSKAADYAEQGIPLAKLPAAVTGPQRPPSKPVSVRIVKEAPKPIVKEFRESTFRDVLEDMCAENSLLMVPLRTVDATTGKALFRITASVDGKGGVTGYIGEGDVLWLQTKRQGPFEPVGLDKIVSLAERR